LTVPPLSTTELFVCAQGDLISADRRQYADCFDLLRVCAGTPVAPAIPVAQVLRWRPRQEVPIRHAKKSPSPSSFLSVGAYAGKARFVPSGRAALTPTLERAIGKIIDVGFAGIAAKGEMFEGQALYLEWRSDDILDGFLIPERDLEFL
jgi:hypothetical protein